MPTLASVIRRLGLGVAACTGAVVVGAVLPSALAGANEPTTLRVVSVTRAGDGQASIVVSVPNRFVATAAATGAFTVVASDGTAIAPAVTSLPPSTAAVALVVDAADGSTADVAARVTGAAAELVRSLMWAWRSRSSRPATPPRPRHRPPIAPHRWRRWRPVPVRSLSRVPTP